MLVWVFWTLSHQSVSRNCNITFIVSFMHLTFSNLFQIFLLYRSKFKSVISLTWYFCSIYNFYFKNFLISDSKELSDLLSNAKFKIISLKLLQYLSARIWLHLPTLSLRSQSDYGLLRSLIISLTHMSCNVVWRQGVESLNEDLPLVKISECTLPPPSLSTFVFLHLCFQTWRGGGGS